MDNLVSGNKRLFPRLTLPFLVSLLLALPLAACGKAGDHATDVQEQSFAIVDTALSDLGGVRDVYGGAYFINYHAEAGKGTAVGIVANNSR